jgi:hypothetical protein
MGILRILIRFNGKFWGILRLKLSEKIDTLD